MISPLPIIFCKFFTLKMGPLRLRQNLGADHALQKALNSREAKPVGPFPSTDRLQWKECLTEIEKKLDRNISPSMVLASTLHRRKIRMYDDNAKWMKACLQKSGS